MKLLIPVLLVFTLSVSAQMDNFTLEQILISQYDSISGQNGRYQLVHNEMPMMVLTDESNDRMRVLTPIIESSKLTEADLLDCMTANFHSALDVKYAVSNDILWSVFVHPLKSLSEEELISAVDQVYAAAITYGTTFSSTPLLFGGQQRTEQVIPKKDSLLLRKI